MILFIQNILCIQVINFPSFPSKLSDQQFFINELNIHTHTLSTYLNHFTNP